jgi:hypothetical protein
MPLLMGMVGSRLLVALSLYAHAMACGPNEPPGESKARILSFTASAQSIALGEEVELSWDVVGTRDVVIEPRIGLEEAKGTARDQPLVTTTYVLTVPTGPKELTAEVTVEVTGNYPRVTTFTASPRTIMEGETAVLEWTTTDADEVEIEPGAIAQPAQGSLPVIPEVTTTYRLIARRGSQISQPSEVTVVVASGNQPFIRSFEANPQTIQLGEQVTLTWEAANSDGVTIDHGIGQLPVSGSVTVMPEETTTYSLTAVGAGGQANASVTVTVLDGGSPTITRFDATPMTIAPGGQVELSWDTDNAEGTEIDNGVGPQMAKGSVMVSPAQTTTYTLTAFGGGMQVTAQVTVTVAAAGAPVVSSFTASPQALISGGTSTLDWTTQNAASVDISGVANGLPANGSVQVTPATTTTFVLTAHGSGSDATAQVTVTVNAPPPQVVSFTASPMSIVAGGQATLAWNTSDATSVFIDNGVGSQSTAGTAVVNPTQPTQYTLMAIGPGGSTTAMVSVTVTQPGAPQVVSFTSSPQQIAPGGQATLSWQVTDATSVTIDRGVGSQPLTGSISVSPASSTTYTLTAVGSGGTTTAQVTVNVVSVVGNTCADAFVISQSGTFTGNTLTAIDDYRDSNACTGFRSTGPDMVYRIPLQAGDRLQATLTPATTWDASLYLLTSCANVAQSCVAGEDNGNPERIDYTPAAGGDFFLIVDGFSGAGGDYSLSVTISPAPIANDTCAGAIDVGFGGNFSGNTTNAANDYTPIASGTGGCTGYTANSNDVAFSVALAAGERLQASLDATWDSSIYLVENCANASGTCADGDDSGNPETIDFTAPSARTYFLIVDGYGTARGSFDLSVTISPPVTGGDVCAQAVMIPAGGGSFQSTTAGLANDYDPAPSCTGYAAPGPDRAYAIALSAGDVVEAVAQFESNLDGSIYAVTNCANLTTCVEGADAALAGQDEVMRFVAQTSATHYLIVDSFGSNESGTHDLTVARYTGETCGDSIPLAFGSTEPYSTQGRTNDYSPNSGGCTGYTASGPDRAYSIAMFAGEQLHVTATGNFDASLYLVSNCADVNGSCLAGSDSGSVEEIAPVFAQSGTYYVIVDGYGGASGSGDLTAEIRSGDTCADAYVVPAGGGTFQGTTAGYAADYGTTQSSGSCTNFTQTGRDAVYRIDLAAGEQVTAALSATWDAALYLISNCANSAGTCVAGQDDGNPESISYTNSTGSAATYYLVVDAWRPSDTTTREGTYTLDIAFP